MRGPRIGGGPAAWAWVAVVVAVVDTLALLVVGVVVLIDDIPTRILADGAFINLVAGPTFPLLAAMILRQRAPDTPRRLDRLAWLLLGIGALCTATGVVFVAASRGLAGDLPLAGMFVWIEGWLWTFVAPSVVLMLLWFPTGEVIGPRWRWAVGGVVAANLCLLVSAAFMPGPNTDFPDPVDNPVGWAAAEPILTLLGTAGQILLALTFFAALTSLALRYLRGDLHVRSQLRWLVLAVAIIAVTIAVPADQSIDAIMLVVNALATFLLPLTLAVALTRGGYTLPRVLVYVLLSTLLLLAYASVVWLCDLVFGGRADRAATLAAAGGVALLFAPLRARLQRGVDRLVYGDRGDPYKVLTDLGRRIAGSPDDLLAQVVEAVAGALRARYVAIELPGDLSPTTAVGMPTKDLVSVPLSLRGGDVGRLVVSQPDPHENYGGRDLALLNDLGRHIAVAAHAAMLTRDLQRSRESLVVAREEERRRIRRDLHDGLGPALAGVVFGLDAVRNTLSLRPEAADRSLAELKTELQSCIADIRRLVYDLRPPALDQLGLIAALEEFAARLRERATLDVCVSAPPMPQLPAAVEVAAYRIVIEAMNNVARHSHASSCSVDLTLDPTELRLSVVDDGIGMRPARRPTSNGLGLAAMAERAAELGGTCRVVPREGGGTRVLAALPLGVPT